MNYKEDYLLWSANAVDIQPGTKKRYVASLERLSQIIGYNIFEENNIDKINQLYNDLIKEQTVEGGRYYDKDAPSYSLRGWYSASIKKYSLFLKDFFEKEDVEPIDLPKISVNNKLAQAICIIGSSGVGKTYRVNKTLQKEGHKILFVIVDNMWQHILFDYSPNDREYYLTKVGDFIRKSFYDPENCYTVVFDECHKNLEIINDVLLQAISTKRNDGVRFISLNSLVDKQFNFLPEINGNRSLPNNLGFLFISSKSDIIEGNDDLKNRIEIIELTEADQSNRDFTIDFLLSKIKIEEESEYTN